MSHQPPVITIASPVDGIEVHEPELTLTYHVRSPSGQRIAEITVTANGRPLLDIQRKALESGVAEETGTLTVRVPPEDAEIAVIAKTANGRPSQPGTIRMRWRGVTDAFKAKLYVLAIGISRYEHYGNLQYADRDAVDFVNQMKRQKGGLYKDVAVHSLVNEQANARAVRLGLNWILHETTQRDIAVVFISGHGVTDRGTYYFLPYDVDPATISATAIPQSDISRVFDQTVGKVIVFLDTCHAGGVQGVKGSEVDINGLANELTKAGRGVVVFMSSTGNQKSFELDDFRHGAFTTALLEGLDGRADYTKDRIVSTSELSVYVPERVKELVRGKGDQMPTMLKPDTTPHLQLFVVP